MRSQLKQIADEKLKKLGTNLPFSIRRAVKQLQQNFKTFLDVQDLDEQTQINMKRIFDDQVNMMEETSDESSDESLISNQSTLEKDQIRAILSDEFEQEDDFTSKLRNRLIKKRNHAAKATSRKFLLHKKTMRRGTQVAAFEHAAKLALGAPTESD